MLQLTSEANFEAESPTYDYAFYAAISHYRNKHLKAEIMAMD